MILDTNIFSALATNDDQVVQLLSSVQEIMLPLPVIAELRSGYVGGSKRSENENKLTRFAAQDSVRVLAPSYETTRYYAELQLHARKQGRILSNNDIWIAALAIELDTPLVTYDKDFGVFANILKHRLILLQH